MFLYISSIKYKKSDIKNMITTATETEGAQLAACDHTEVFMAVESLGKCLRALQVAFSDHSIIVA